jgi:hypothetical protein
MAYLFLDPYSPLYPFDDEEDYIHLHICLVVVHHIPHMDLSSYYQILVSHDKVDEDLQMVAYEMLLEEAHRNDLLLYHMQEEDILHLAFHEQVEVEKHCMASYRLYLFPYGPPYAFPLLLNAYYLYCSLLLSTGSYC